MPPVRKITNKLGRRVNRLLSEDWERKLHKIEKAIPINNTKVRVLIGPSFAIYPPSYTMDKSLAIALKLKGAEIIPIYCDGVQDVECNFVGGDWTKQASFEKNCSNCRKKSERLWRINSEKTLRFSSYLSDQDINHITDIVSALSFEETLGFNLNGIAYGRMAKDILVNNYLVATPSLVDNHKYLLKIHLNNLLRVSLIYERILDEKKPDRVVSNDSYYGMWALLEHHCKTREIPFYSHWPATRNRVAFAYNDAAMNLDLKASWENFLKKTLSKEDEEKVEKWLVGERGYVIDTTKLGGHEQNDPILGEIDLDKPTIVLAANVIWDLAALDKQIIFNDMIEWIAETIDWFASNNNVQLVIKPHPAETAPKIPRTNENVAKALNERGVIFPKNVFLLKPDTNVTLNTLLTDYDVRCVLVHSTTVGFECPARKIPVITSARSPYRGFGFTIDPQNKYEYFLYLSEQLSERAKLVSDEQQILAKKFIKFYQFHYYSNIGLFSGNPPDISDDFMSVLDDNDGAFTYVVNSIIQGLPINGEDRWLPET